VNYSSNPLLNPREIELKFLLAPGARETLEESRPFMAVKNKTLHELTTYFDTSNALLNSAGLTFRVRRIGAGQYVQTVKSREKGLDIAANRGEWEWPLDGAMPDIGKLKEIQGLVRIAEQIEGRLQPIFVSDIHRTVRLLHLDGISSVEAVIDVGSIRSGTAGEPVSELELELKSGDVQSMYRLAAKLQKLAAFSISSESKAARGWHLRTGQTEGAQEAGRLVFVSSVRTADGFHRIISETLQHLIANIGPTLRGDPEGLHQMRGALKESRAALELFKEHLDWTAAKVFDCELRRYGQIFGIARDWDVFCLQTMPAAMGDLPAERLRDLNRVADVQRRTAHAAIVKAIEGSQFTALVLNIAVWAAARSKQASTSGHRPMDKPLLAVAPELLARAARRVKKKAHKLGSLSAKGLHRLRKSFDDLGSDVRFLSSLYSGHDLKIYRRRCKAIKAVLGSNNDALVTRDLSAKLVTEDRPDLAKPAAALRLWSNHRHRKVLKGLKGAYQDFREAPGFWS